MQFQVPKVQKKMCQIIKRNDLNSATMYFSSLKEMSGNLKSGKKGIKNDSVSN